MKVILANGKTVKVSLGEIRDFITEMPTTLPNPDWHYSELLTEDEVMRFLKGEGSQKDLKKVAQYILIYTENLAFTAYLFDKAEGKPDQTREFNMPAVKKLREIHRRVTENQQTAEALAGDVHEMENICLKIGVDPL